MIDFRFGESNLKGTVTECSCLFSNLPCCQVLFVIFLIARVCSHVFLVLHHQSLHLTRAYFYSKDFIFQIFFTAGALVQFFIFHGLGGHNFRPQLALKFLCVLVGELLDNILLRAL